MAVIGLGIAEIVPISIDKSINHWFRDFISSNFTQKIVYLGISIKSDDVSIRQLIQSGAQIQHSQVTDVFLLGLAAHNKGKLATFDQRIPVEGVKRGAESLELLDFD